MSYYKKNRQVTLKDVLPQQVVLATLAERSRGPRCDESLDVYRVLVAMHNVNPDEAYRMWRAFAGDNHNGSSKPQQHQRMQHQPIKIAGFSYNDFAKKSLLHYDYFINHFSVKSDKSGKPVGPLKAKPHPKAVGKVVLYNRDLRKAVVSFMRSQPNKCATMGEVRAALLEKYHFRKGDLPLAFSPTTCTHRNNGGLPKQGLSPLQLAQAGGSSTFQPGYHPFQLGQYPGMVPPYPPGQFQGLPSFHPWQVQGIPPPANVNTNTNPNNERRPKPEQRQGLLPLQLAQARPEQVPSSQHGQLRGMPSFAGQFPGFPAPQQLGMAAGYSAPNVLLQQRYALNMAQQRNAFVQQQKEMLQQQTNTMQQQYHHTMFQAYREAMTRRQVPPPVVPASSTVHANSKSGSTVDDTGKRKQAELIGRVNKKPRCDGDGANTQARNISEKTNTSSDDVEQSTADSVDESCKKESVFRKTLSGLANFFGFGSSHPAKESG